MNVKAKNDNRVVVTWALANGVLSCLDNLAEWSDMYAHQSRSRMFECILTDALTTATVRTHDNGATGE